MIKRNHTEPYKCKISSNKVDYSTAVDPYCTKHNVKVKFFMPDFSSSKIIMRRYHVVKTKVSTALAMT